MPGEQPQKDVMAQGREGIVADGSRTGPLRLSRRQVMGQISVVTAAGAVAWAVPEILTARPAAGAALSSPLGDGVSIGGSTDRLATNGPEAATATVHASPAAATADPLAFTGLNVQRDAEVGAALVAGGWAMQHWASREAKPAGTAPSGSQQAGAAASD